MQKFPQKGYAYTNNYNMFAFFLILSPEGVLPQIERNIDLIRSPEGVLKYGLGVFVDTKTLSLIHRVYKVYSIEDKKDAILSLIRRVYTKNAAEKNNQLILSLTRRVCTYRSLVAFCWAILSLILRVYLYWKHCKYYAVILSLILRVQLRLGCLLQSFNSIPNT